MHVRVTETIAFFELKKLKLNRMWIEADNFEKEKVIYPSFQRRNTLVNIFRRNSSVSTERTSKSSNGRSLDEVIQMAVMRIQSKLS
jgi:hypothetical protein